MIWMAMYGNGDMMICDDDDDKIVTMMNNIHLSTDRSRGVDNDHSKRRNQCENSDMIICDEKMMTMMTTATISTSP